MSGETYNRVVETVEETDPVIAESVIEESPRLPVPPSVGDSGGPRGFLRRIADPRYLAVAGTLATLALILIVGQLRYGTDRSPFVSPRMLSNLAMDNAYLVVLAVGMTFVILTGGIDLSVGAIVALTGLVIAQMLIHGIPLVIALISALVIGALFGLGIGCLVHYFKIQPFIASLAGMFLARGMCNLVSVQSLAIDQEGFSRMASWDVDFGSGVHGFSINLSMIIAALVALAAFLLLHYTRFGRTVYGLGAGDNGQAVGLMGLNGGLTTLMVYVISGTCAGIAGILFALYTRSGYNLTGVGMELDAIASVVIGGALLAGGAGFVLGSVSGVAVYGLIQVLNAREGLDSWWTKVFIGAVILAFVLLQRLIASRELKRNAGGDVDEVVTDDEAAVVIG